MADALGQRDVHLRALLSQALHVFQVGVGRLQERFGRYQLPAAHVFLEPFELLGLEPWG